MGRSPFTLAASAAASAVTDGFFELLFPTRCAGCELPGELVCDRCRDALPVIDPATACPDCGAPYGWLVCTECWDTDLGLDGAVSVGVLDRPLSRCVTIYKDAHERRLAEVLGRLLVDAIEERWGTGSTSDTIPAAAADIAASDASGRIADAIVPIPTSSRAIRTRGYDHTLLLAQCVSRLTGIPCLTTLTHVRAADQRRLTREERLANVAGAFELASADRRIPDRVLVVDDVMTTGATLMAAARLLRAGGAREVRAGFVARAW